MSNTNTGGPAFPTTIRSHYSGDTGSTWSEHIEPGMSIRDYFATKALVAVFTDAMDYMVGDCRVLANPRGYKGYEAVADYFQVKSFEV